MKLMVCQGINGRIAVTLSARVWIEIHWAICFLLDMDVTLSARVWIEIGLYGE